MHTTLAHNKQTVEMDKNNIKFKTTTLKSQQTNVMKTLKNTPKTKRL